MPSERRHVSRASAAPARIAIDPSPTLLPAIVACAAPALLAFNLPPSPTLFNQAAALAGWGLFVAAGAAANRSNPVRAGSASLPLTLALGLLAGAALWACSVGPLPGSLGWPAAGLLAATIVMVLAGASVEGAQREALATTFFTGWLVAGVASTGIALVQVFAPDWADGEWIANSGMPGRAVGNLRQPNHLSSLLLWSAIAVVPLLESRRMPRSVAAVLMGVLMVGVELSGSRTGLIGVGVLALWGLLDRRLSMPSRMLLWSAPLAYGACALGLSLGTAGDDAAIGVAAKLAVSDISSSRFGIWANTLELIRMHPWAGVGFGEFNFAWTLTPFPGRPVAFFDHTHNLPLQLMVELGLPLAALVLLLLAAALWRGGRGAWLPDGADGATMRALFVMVLMMALHSQLEYPLWYAHFLLPTAWAWGVCLGATAVHAPASARRAPAAMIVLAGAAMMLGAGGVLADYLRVVRIFAPAADAAPLAQRIQDGQRSLFFGHHADYAAATTAAPAHAAAAPMRAPHYLLDARLLMAWARAYAAAGDLDRARYLAQRLREFNNPQAAEFFAACGEADRDGLKPFQCEAPAKPLTWQDFR